MDDASETKSNPAAAYATAGSISIEASSGYKKTRLAFAGEVGWSSLIGRDRDGRKTLKEFRLTINRFTTAVIATAMPSSDRDG